MVTDEEQLQEAEPAFTMGAWISIEITDENGDVVWEDDYPEDMMTIEEAKTYSWSAFRAEQAAAAAQENTHVN